MPPPPWESPLIGRVDRLIVELDALIDERRWLIRLADMALGNLDRITEECDAHLRGDGADRRFGQVAG